MIKITDSLIKVLNFIWKNEQTSLMEISKKTKLEKSTVSRTLNKLKEINLVKKIGEIDASPQGGRKTNILSLNHTAGKIMGISVEQDGIEYVITYLNGNMIKKERINEEISEENIIQKILEVININMDENVYGIGISVPGIIDSKEGIIIHSKALKIKDFALVSEIEKYIDIPIFIENDSNCGALYFNLNNKKKSKNVLYFHISIPYHIKDSIGIGTGIIIKNKLYHGSNNLSGEVEIRHPLLNVKNNITFADVLKYDEEKILSEGKEFLDFYSYELAKIISVFDPDAVLIGGNITLLPKRFMDTFIDNINKKIFLNEIRKLCIDYASSQDFLTSHGAASLILHKLFSTNDGIEKFLTKYLKKRDNMKFGKLFFLGFPDGLDDEALEIISKYKPAGIILYPDNMKSLEELQISMDKLYSLDLPLLISSDHEGGQLETVPGILSFSGNYAMGRLNKPEIAYEYGKYLGNKLKEYGFNMVFSPVLDVLHKNSSAVTGFRAFSTSADIVAEYGLSYIKGLKEQGYYLLQNISRVTERLHRILMKKLL
nr:ROK family protein [Marinitoga lauensis]